MSTPISLRALLLLTLLSTAWIRLSAAPLGTAFTYQGRLSDGTNAASGIYGLHFTIYDLSAGGSAVGGPLTNSSVAVSNGLFAVSLDFGAAAFNGNACWLEVAVRTNGPAGAFRVLSPRQPIMPTPYALMARQLPNDANATFGGVVRFEPAVGAPFQVGSSLRVTNLNADLLDGLDASAFLLRTQQCAATFSELESFPPGAAPYVLLLGYHWPRDGGGGLFQWDAAATDPADGGTVVVPAGSAPAGRWKRLIPGPISVRFFGATGQGTNDDSSAIQHAIYSAAAGGGTATVFIPRGTYKVTCRLDLATAGGQPANGVTISGEGADSFLAFDHQGLDGRGVALHGLGVSNLVIRDLRLGPSPGGGGFSSGIYLDGGRNITIRNNDISGVLLTNSGYAAGIYLSGGIKDVWILDNDLHDNGVPDRPSWHILVYPDMAGFGANRVQIRGNRCGPNRLAGSLDPTTGIGIFNSTYVTLLENYVEGVRYETGGSFGDQATGYGIMVYRGSGGIYHHHVVQGNVIRRTGGCGLYIQGNPYTTITGNLLEDIAKDQPSTTLVIGGIGVNEGPAAITGNTIRNVGLGINNLNKPFGIGIQSQISTTNGPGYRDAGGVARGITVSGNTIENTTGYGIALEAGPGSAADNSTVIGNTLVNTAGGIATVGDQPISGLAIVGNSIVRSTNSPSTDRHPGIYLNATAQAAISQNVIANMGGQGIVVYANSSRTVVSGNTVRDSGLAEPNGYPNIQVGGTNNLIFGNHCYSSGTNVSLQNAGILESGWHNDLWGNNVSGSSPSSALALQSSGVATSRSNNRLTADPVQGVVNLANGTVTVSSIEVQYGDIIQVTRLLAAGSQGHLSVVNVLPGSFIINSSDPGDNSQILWKILH